MPGSTAVKTYSPASLVWPVRTACVPRWSARLPRRAARRSRPSPRRGRRRCSFAPRDARARPRDHCRQPAGFIRQPRSASAHALSLPFQSGNSCFPTELSVARARSHDRNRSRPRGARQIERPVCGVLSCRSKRGASGAGLVPGRGASARNRRRNRRRRRREGSVCGRAGMWNRQVARGRRAPAANNVLSAEV